MVDSIAVSVFFLFWLTLKNGETITTRAPFGVNDKVGWEFFVFQTQQQQQPLETQNTAGRRYTCWAMFNHETRRRGKVET